MAEARQRELLVEEVQRMAPPTFDPAEIQAHFNNVPPRYCQVNDAREILRDVTQVHRFIHLQLTAGDENALAPIIAWQNDPDRGYSTATLCTWDRERLFSNITGCLTAAGFNILSAEILTRADGVIIDTFFVTDARTGLPAGREEREKFESLAHKVLTGAAVDLPALIARTKAAPTIYKSIEGERIPTVIEVDNETSELRSVIDVQAEDRVGLLYDISRALADLDLNLSLAKIVTEKGAAVDSFYATERHGGKILEPRSHPGRQTQTAPGRAASRPPRPAWPVIPEIVHDGGGRSWEPRLYAALLEVVDGCNCSAEFATCPFSLVRVARDAKKGVASNCGSDTNCAGMVLNQKNGDRGVAVGRLYVLRFALWAVRHSVLPLVRRA